MILPAWVYRAATALTALGLIAAIGKVLGLITLPWLVIGAAFVPAFALVGIIIFFVLAWMAGGSH